MEEPGYIKKIAVRGLCSISFFMISALYPVINRYTGRERDITTVIDNLIPFNRYFILAYVFWYVYIAAFLIYFCLFDAKKYYKTLTGINVGMLICFFIYLLFPTTVPRHTFNQGNDIIGYLFKWLYSNDAPYNCFPSIHILNTIIIAIYVQKDNLYLNKYIKIASFVCAALIIYSTFAIKQHVVLDGVSASVIAYGLYVVMDYKEVFARIKRPERLPEA